MKKLFLFLAMAIIMLPALALAVTAEWDAYTATYPGGGTVVVQGFNLYETTTLPRVKVNSALIPAGSTTYLIPTGVASVGDKFVLTVIDSFGQESDPSNEARYLVKPPAPGSGVPGWLLEIIPSP